MKKTKVDGEWRITLTKTERSHLADAAAVLTDLRELDANTESVRDGVRSIIKCISDDGVYSEAVPTTDAAK